MGDGIAADQVDAVAAINQTAAAWTTVAHLGLFSENDGIPAREAQKALKALRLTGRGYPCVCEGLSSKHFWQLRLGVLYSERSFRNRVSMDQKLEVSGVAKSKLKLGCDDFLGKSEQLLGPWKI